MRITHFLSDILEYQLIFLIVLRTKFVKCYQRSQWLNHIGGNNLTTRQAAAPRNNHQYHIIYNLFNFTHSEAYIHPYGGRISMQASVKYVIIRLSYQVFFQNVTYETLTLYGFRNK